MTTGATGQLGLALPVQGELSGTWGDTVNNGITQYTNIAIAGTLTLTNDGAVTLANTIGDASASNITSTLTGAGTVTAQFAIVRVTGTLTTAKVVTGPSYSKTYTVVNAATGGIVTFKASGQTGVSVAVGESAFVYYNGTDYVKLVGTATAGAAGGSNTQVQYNSSGVLAGSANMTFDGTTLTAAGFSGPHNGTVGATTANTGAFTTLAASSTVTLSGGTANGVTYLNGSKVLTSGSALTFDGTTLYTSGAFQSQGGTADTVSITGGNAVASNSTSGLTLNASSGSGFIALRVAGDERARITTTGLGIGTTSPSTTLDVASSNSGITLTNTAVSNKKWRLGGNASGYFVITESGVADRMFIDTSGNLGLGVTPSAWSSGKAIEVGFAGRGLWGLNQTVGYLSTNAYFNSGWKYGGTGAAATYGQDAGSHLWQTAASGTAGNAITFTTAMTLDASGNLLVGATSDPAGFSASQRFVFTGDTRTDGSGVYPVTGTLFDSRAYNSTSPQPGGGLGFGYKYNTAGSYAIGPSIQGFKENTTDGNYAGGLRFLTRANGASPAEAARIDSSGNLLVGTTSAGGGANVKGVTLNNTGQIAVERDGGIAGVFNRFTSDGSIIIFRRSATQVGSIDVTTVLTTYNTTSDYRLKTVVGSVTGHGARIDALEPVEYTWNANGIRSRGFLAHKFQEVYASSVNGEKDALDEDGNPAYQTMQASTSEVIADLVAEIQSLRQRLSAANL